ncbi:MAG: hypothetical protein CO017_02235 [Zetaproteobacteria bacterium CG_4_8_14_3_um_filter_59_5]|nr:MAG: hypothetical protein CO017_02235 [Zetaproteobacteria bacterium CG_4_8_14_3_um_filter_59_5]
MAAYPRHPAAEQRSWFSHRCEASPDHLRPATPRWSWHSGHARWCRQPPCRPPAPSRHCRAT